jgi:SAM-dependent methyltransferase
MSVVVDDAVAADYSDHLGPSLLAMTATLMALAGIRTGESVLDLACGPGLLTLPAAAAASSSGRVVAVDGNPAMLARGAARTSPATDAAPISWVHSLDGALPLADAAVDKVVCGAKLQHFDDARAALAEVRRVLRPGGRFSVSAWGSLLPDAVETAVLDAFDRHGLREACTRRTDLSVAGRLVPATDLPELVASAGLQVGHVASATVTVPFVDAIAYTRWRLSFPRTCAALVGRGDAAEVRADVLDAVTGAHGAGPVLLELPVHYTVSRAG